MTPITRTYRLDPRTYRRWLAVLAAQWPCPAPIYPEADPHPTLSGEAL